MVKQADWHGAILCPVRHPAKPSCLHLSLLVPSSWSPRWGRCLYSPVPPPTPPRWLWQPCSSEGSPGPASPSGVTLQNFLPLNRTGPKTRTAWLRPGALSPLPPRARPAHAWVPVAPTYSHLHPPRSAASPSPASPAVHGKVLVPAGSRCCSLASRSLFSSRFPIFIQSDTHLPLRARRSQPEPCLPGTP